jgi:hypothetical protein
LRKISMPDSDFIRGRWKSGRRVCRTTPMVGVRGSTLSTMKLWRGWGTHFVEGLRFPKNLGPPPVFVNVQSVDRIIHSIFLKFNLEWKNPTLRVFTQAA